MSNKNKEKNDEKKVLPGLPINCLITVFPILLKKPVK